MLDINGESAGFVKKFSGFAMEADIVSNALGPDNVQKKHVARTRWTPGKATIGIGMGNECYQWIKAAFDKGYVDQERVVHRGRLQLQGDFVPDVP